MPETSTEWQSAHLARTYLEGVRGAIPLAEQQLDVLLTIVRNWLPRLGTVVDLGCGDGILGRTVLREHSHAQAWFIDISPAMLQAARDALPDGARARFVLADLAQSDWRDRLALPGPVDLVLSGFAIHHLAHERKRALYAEIHALLAPGGVFLNLEHVASPTPTVEALFEDHFVDHLYAYHRRNGNRQSREELARTYYARQDKEENILAPVEEQCDWLRRIGYEDVDCFFKCFELALFGGRRGV